MRKKPVENLRESPPHAFHEACRLMIDGRAVAVAQQFGKSDAAVYTWMEDPGGCGRIMPGNLIVPISRFLDDYRLIEWMANQVGLITYKIPEGEFNGRNFNQLALLSKEFGESLEAVGESLKDGKITSEEMSKIETEFFHLMTQAKRTLEILRSQEIKGRVNGNKSIA